MEDVRAGQIGQQHPDGNGQEQKRFKAASDGKVDQHSDNQEHDQRLPAGGVEHPAAPRQRKLIAFLEKQLPDACLGQKIQQTIKHNSGFPFIPSGAEHRLCPDKSQSRSSYFRVSRT